MELLVLTILVTLAARSVGQSTVRSGRLCRVPGQEVTQCDTRLRCQYGRWTPVARCILGYAYGNGRQCDISNSSRICTGPSLPAPIVARPSSRVKRQAFRDCSAVLDCPAGLTLSFPYPDWRDCGSFFVCTAGRLEQVSCREHGFRFYNPNRYDCENVWSPDNVCLDNLHGF